MDKIATAEELQAEIRTLLAMTEEEASPSRAKMAKALADLAERVAGTKQADAIDDLVDVKEALKSKDLQAFKKAVNEFNGYTACKLLIEAMMTTSVRLNDVSKLLGRVKT